MGRHQQYPVPLDEEERHWLLTFINTGDSGARKLKRAHILLLASEGKNDREVQGRRRSARQCQMTHDEISSVTSRDQIEQFLDDLSYAIRVEKAKTVAKNCIPLEEIEIVQRDIMAQGGNCWLTEEDYGDVLADWVVSSSPG